jgi:hypothetical protein
MPALNRLLTRAAIADLSTRVFHEHTSPGDGYLTLGAGTRAEGKAGIDGLAFEPDERFGAGTAADAFAKHTGTRPRSGVDVLGLPELVARNRRLLFDARPGALGDALARAKWHAAVIANADGGPPDPPASWTHREAALGLVDHTGRIPVGSVSDRLLLADPAAPYGRRLDPDAVTRELTRSWTDHTVALVEASDLPRADSARRFTPPAQRRVVLDTVLRQTDELIDGLMRQVDPTHDAVLLVSPYHAGSRVELTVTAMQAPDVTGGLLRSPTTRRSGFVQIVDVAPTVLDLAGIARPDKMEGRPFEARQGGGSLDARMRMLVDADRFARFRDAHLATVGTAVVVASLTLAAATALALARRPRWARIPLQAAALALPGFLVGTYLARVAGFESGSTAAYWAFLLAVAGVFSAGCLLAGRRRPPLALGIALGALAAMHVADAFTGARLELSTVFGYSPLAGIRLAGLGNMAYAQLSGAALALCALSAWIIGARRGATLGIAVLAVALVTIAAPFWGQNFGGALAAAPVFVLVGLVLSGRRVRVRTVGVLAGSAVLVGLAIGFVDLLRPSGSRTHVGRFFERVGADGWHGFALVVHRKANQSLGTLRHSVWTPMTVGALMFLGFLLWRCRGDLTDLRHRQPALWAVVVGLPALLVLGFALKDSGIAVPGMTLVVANVAAVYLSLNVSSPD